MKSIDVKDPSYIDDENPEWTQANIDNSLTFEQMPPELQALVLYSRERKRGRPLSENKKVSVTLRLSADVLERFRATGKGWQTRINEVLTQHSLSL